MQNTCSALNALREQGTQRWTTIMMPVMTELIMNISFIYVDTFWAFIFVALIIRLFPECYKLLMEHKFFFFLLHCGSCYILISVLMQHSITSFAAQIYVRCKLFRPPMTNAIDVPTFACECIKYFTSYSVWILNDRLSVLNILLHMTTALVYIFDDFVWLRDDDKDNENDNCTWFSKFLLFSCSQLKQDLSITL